MLCSGCILWIPAIGLFVFGIYGLTGRGIRFTRETTLHGRQAKIVGGLCTAGALLISPIGIMVISTLFMEPGRSRRRPLPSARPSSNSPSSPSTLPPPPPPPGTSLPPPPPAASPSPPAKGPSARPADTSPSRWQSRVRRPSNASAGSAQPRRRVVVFQLLGYSGRDDPTEAAREALKHIPWAIATNVQVDLDARELVIPLRTGNLNTGPAKAALQQAGFQIGRTTVTSRQQ